MANFLLESTLWYFISFSYVILFINAFLWSNYLHDSEILNWISQIHFSIFFSFFFLCTIDIIKDDWNIFHAQLNSRARMSCSLQNGFGSTSTFLTQEFDQKHNHRCIITFKCQKPNNSANNKSMTVGNIPHK